MLGSTHLGGLSWPPEGNVHSRASSGLHMWVTELAVGRDGWPCAVLGEVIAEGRGASKKAGCFSVLPRRT